MNLSAMRYLVALREHGHFARAAAACHVTQPALSNALRALERELGSAVVKRGRTFAGFTEEGERVLLAARRMLREQELLQQDLRGSAAEPRGCVRLGVVPTAVPIAARFAALLQQRHGQVLVEVRSLSSPAIDAGLQDLTLDLGLGFVERHARSERFELLPQYEERSFLLQRRAGAGGLRLGPPCTWKEAASLRLCLLSPEMHHRHIVDAAFAEAGMVPTPLLETNSISALMLAVAHGGLAAVVPGALAANAPGEVALEALPLVRPTRLTPVGFMVLGQATQSRALSAALALAHSDAWAAVVRANAGQLTSFGT